MWTQRPARPFPNRRGRNTWLTSSAMKAAMKWRVKLTSYSISLTSTSLYRRTKLGPLWLVSLKEFTLYCQR